jgi:hypothetical protein
LEWFLFERITPKKKRPLLITHEMRKMPFQNKKEKKKQERKV